jgi:hypothetical protein
MTAKVSRDRPNLGVGLLSFNTSLVSNHSWADSYRAGINIARTAESLGLESVWLSEHHFVPDGYCPTLMPVAGSILAATEKLVVGTAVVLLPLADPARLCQQVRSLGSLAQRLRLGVALGYREEEFKGLGRVRRERGRVMDRHIEHLIDEIGELGTLTIAAASHVGVSRAIKYDLPLLIDGAVPFSSVVDWVNEYRAVSDKEVTVSRECWINSEGVAAPHAVADREFGYAQYVSWDWSDTHDDQSNPNDGAAMDQLDEIIEWSRGHWLRATERDFDAVLAGLYAVGVDRVHCRLSWSGVPLDEEVVRAIAATGAAS